MLHYDLATLAWLKNPARAPELPRRQIIADCVATLRPSDRLWAKFMKEAEHLERRGEITPDELTVLRFEPEAERILATATLGQEANVGERTVHEVLEAAVEAIRQPLRVSGEAALEQVQAKADQGAELAKAAESKTKAVIQAIRDDCKRRASRRAHLIVRLTLGLPIYLFAALVLTCSVLSELNVTPFSGTVIGIGAAIMVAIVGLAAVDYFLGLGPSVRQCLHRLQTRVQAKLEARYLSQLPPEVRVADSAAEGARELVVH